MIDAILDATIALDEVPRYMPKRKDKPVSVETVRNWVYNGVRGHRLESLLVGGKRVTTMNAVREFLQKINGQTTT